MKNTTLKLAENDYLILEYLKLNPSATEKSIICLLYTSDAADEEDSEDLGGRRINKKKNKKKKR